MLFDIDLHRKAVGFRPVYELVKARMLRLSEELVQPYSVLRSNRPDLSFEELIQDAGIAPRAAAMLASFWKIWLCSHSEGLQTQVYDTKTTSDTSNTLPDCSSATNDPFLVLLDRFELGLPSFLSGDRTGVEVLFPKGDLSLWAAVHDASALMSQYAEAGSQLLLHVVRPDDQVLEIGGGTAAGARRILHNIEPHVLGRFLFTDVSTSMLRFARNFLPVREDVTFRTFDFERDPLSQGFSFESFDVIFGVNALHVARNLDQALMHISSILRPGGWLVLGEGAPGPNCCWYADPVFCMLDGWWNVRIIPKRRPTYGFLSASEWAACMADHGLERISDFASARFWDDSFGGAIAFRKSRSNRACLL